MDRDADVGDPGYLATQMEQSLSVHVQRVRSTERELAEMVEEVRAGLSSSAPSIPCKYFYDDRGSELFDAITRLPEYYQTRTEESILEGIARDVVDAVSPRELVELGSGTGSKIRMLLDEATRGGRLESCVFLDVSEGVLRESLEGLEGKHPRLRLRGIVGDFTRDLHALGCAGGRMMVFFGGTLGNLHPADVPAFLASVAATLEPGGAFLLGVDLVKDHARLHAAYNDSAGVTAEFNRNILHVLNTRLGADFEPGAFEHVAFYDVERAWIDVRLRARKDMRVHIPSAGLDLAYAAGDEIRTEISCKYTRASLDERMRGTGLVIERWHTDLDELFALALLRRTR